MKRALITGVLGSGGSYLADHLIEEHPETKVFGIGRWHSHATHKNIEHIKDKITLIDCDLTDLSSVVTALKQINPDGIFHLASYANVRASFQNPLSTLANNITATANLFEALRLLEMRPRFQHCSTSEVYGQVEAHETPITESQPLRPASPYAVSKAAQDLLAHSYYMAYGIPVIRTRMFTYLNPRRLDLFATAFADQVARIEAGLQEELTHGNLDSLRTIIDARDAMRAYYVAIKLGVPGEAYNIGGTTTVFVGDFLELLKKKAKCPIKSRQDPSLLRPKDVTLQIPDTSKFEKATHWKARYSFEDSVDFLLNERRRAHGLV